MGCTSRINGLQPWCTKTVSNLSPCPNSNPDPDFQALPYVEPPRFYYPNRHCLGFLLLKTNATRSRVRVRVRVRDRGRGMGRGRVRGMVRVRVYNASD